MLRRRVALLLGVVAFLAARAPASAAPPSVVFVLLDTTRADRFSSWGNSRPTTPALDALAATGVRFVRHFANAHATRPSMPQLMSGRYYHQNILGPFQTDAHPREMSFARADPTAVLLPALLHANGYATIGVSAHTWVAPDSDLGRGFDRLELLPFTAAEGHGDAKPLVDRAIALWEARDRSRPLFLYLHLMDMHIPRMLPEGGLRFPVDGYDARRFRPNGEPDFDRNRRRWSRYDARDFTPGDRAYYASVYDTRLQYADEQLARLFVALRRDDPELRDTVVVVTADHGEELGEDGRIEHLASFADGVHHVPWIVAGGPVERGGRCDAVTEHVDVVPSLAALLGVRPAPGTVFDGEARLSASGRLAQPCGANAAFYAWEDYRAVRTHHYVLVVRPPQSIDARCEGATLLYHLDGPHRRRVAGSPRRLARLRSLVDARLEARDARFRATRYDPPTTAFLMRTDFWNLSQAPRCVQVDEDTPRATLTADGWMWSGLGLHVGRHADPLQVQVSVPDGSYAVEVAATPVDPPPWLFGFAHWRRQSFLHDEPSQFLPLGPVAATGGLVTLTLGENVGIGHHVLGLRFVPPGASSRPIGLDTKERDRLRALGYVQ
jgi:arylsulfatase A-like enzyme